MRLSCWVFRSRCLIIFCLAKTTQKNRSLIFTIPRSLCSLLGTLRLTLCFSFPAIRLFSRAIEAYVWRASSWTCDISRSQEVSRINKMVPDIETARCGWELEGDDNTVWRCSWDQVDAEVKRKPMRMISFLRVFLWYSIFCCHFSLCCRIHFHPCIFAFRKLVVRV